MNADRFPELEILCTDRERYYYANGGSGPYYVDLRRCPNTPEVFHEVLQQYNKLQDQEESGPDLKPVYVGVPAAGVLFAAGLAYLNNCPLLVLEKKNLQRMWYYSDVKVLVHDFIMEHHITQEEDPIFLGLEDTGILYSTLLGLKFDAPSAIFRRVSKGHGTSKTIETDILQLLDERPRKVYIIDDPYDPLGNSEIMETFSNLPDSPEIYAKITGVEVLLPKRCGDVVPNNITAQHLIITEDLWTTGTSAITVYHSIKETLQVEPQIQAFLDRQQGAKERFCKLNAKARCACTILDIMQNPVIEAKIDKVKYNRVMEYVESFKKEGFMKRLVEHNKSSVCVGVDITPSKMPELQKDTKLPNFPYLRNDCSVAQSVKQYALDVISDIAAVPGVGVIKPNLAYYNSLTDSEMQGIIQAILEHAKSLGLLVILDTKIGDISRTQAQYAEKYKGFDAVTCHGYMGADSINPITDAGLGCFVLVLTSNPSREDLETKIVLTKGLMDYIHKCPSVTYEDITRTPNHVYDVMAQKVIDMQYAGSIGAVIGGTPNQNGELEELKGLIELFAEHLDYLPPILIPGVGTQGGSAKDVTAAIVQVLKELKWSSEKIRMEMRKVLINSASAIDYAPSPRQAAQDLVNKVQEALTENLS